MLNKLFFSIYIKENIKRLDQQIRDNYFTSVEEKFRAEGQRDVYKKLYEEYNLEDLSKEDIEYRKDF